MSEPTSRERGHAAAEFALAVGVLMFPVAIVVMSFGPWSEHRVAARSLAAEAARAAVLSLDQSGAQSQVVASLPSYRLDQTQVRLGWCGAPPGALDGLAGGCPLGRGTAVVAEVEVWTPLFATPWGGVGGLWVSASHSEPIDLYRSLG